MLGISRDSESHSLRSLFYHFELGMQIYARQMQSRAPSQKCHGSLPLDLEAQVSRCKSGPLSLSQWLKIQASLLITYQQASPLWLWDFK